MVAASVRSVGTPNSGTGAVTYTIPTHQAGDWLYLVIETSDSAGVTAPSGWAHITNSPRPQGSNVTAVNVLRRLATSASETNPTVADPGNHQVGRVIVVQDADPGGALDFAPIGDGQAGTTTFATTAGTTTGVDRLVMAVITDNTDTASDQFSGVTNGSVASLTHVGGAPAATTLGNGGGVHVYTGVRATAGTTGSFAGNIATPSAWSSLVFAIAPAPSSTPISASDTGSGADTTAIAAATDATDTAAGADTAAVAAQTGVTDTGAGLDALSDVSAAIALTDTGTGADTATTATEQAASDTGAAADGLDSITVDLGAADTLAGAEDATLTVDVALVDTAVGSDDLTTGSDAAPDLDDTATADEDATLAAATTAADTGNSVEVLDTIDVDLALTDTTTADDTLTISEEASVDLDDTATSSDTTAVEPVLVLADAATGSDDMTVTVILEPADTATLADDAATEAAALLDDLLTGVDAISIEIPSTLPAAPDRRGHPAITSRTGNITADPRVNTPTSASRVYPATDTRRYTP